MEDIFKRLPSYSACHTEITFSIPHYLLQTLSLRPNRGIQSWVSQSICLALDSTNLCLVSQYFYHTTTSCWGHAGDAAVLPCPWTSSEQPLPSCFAVRVNLWNNASSPHNFKGTFLNSSSTWLHITICLRMQIFKQQSWNS